MKIAKLALFVAAGAIAAPAAAVGPEQDSEVWATVSATGALSGKVLGTLELTARADDRGTRKATTVVRSMLGYQASKDVSVWVGYVRQSSYPEGRSANDENRLFQQVSWNLGKLGGAAISSRTRFEQRTVEGRNDVGFRVRQRIGVNVPLRKGGPSAVFTTEPFFNLNSTDFGSVSGFDNWRNFAGVNVPVTKQLSVETGYLNRYTRRRAARDRMDHIVPVTLAYRF